MRNFPKLMDTCGEVWEAFKKKTIFFVTNVTLWGEGGGLERVHVTKKNHSLKIIFKQF